MKKTIAVAAFVAVAIPAFAQQNASWTRPFEPFKVIDNTYYVGSEGLTAFLITTPKGHVLLDVGVPANAEMVEKNIETLGFKVRDIKILLNSHGHFDHSGGLAKLKADSGAQLVSSEGEVYALEKGVYPGSENNRGMNFPAVKVDRKVKDGDVVELGGVKFTANVTPGHTKGCTSWSWPVKDRDGLAHTAINFCSATVAANKLVPEQYPGIVADYRKTFARGKSLPGDVFLAPHGEFFGLAAKKARLGQPGPNPFIDRAGFEKLLDAQHAAFETSLAAAQKAQAK